MDPSNVCLLKYIKNMKYLHVFVRENTQKKDAMTFFDNQNGHQLAKFTVNQLQILGRYYMHSSYQYLLCNLLKKNDIDDILAIDLPHYFYYLGRWRYLDGIYDSAKKYMVLSSCVSVKMYHKIVSLRALTDNCFINKE